jgi:nitroreductase
MMRTADYAKLDNMFIERWSPRAFLPDSIAEEDIKTLFEATRWSPSCFNEQPWRFVYAHKPSDLEKFRSVLKESNQVWANHAPLLVIAFSHKLFAHNGAPNRWADFDSGAAWMALTLQANRLGLRTHGIGGFDQSKAYEVTGVDPELHKAICMIAIGKKAEAKTLPDELQAREAPSDRKALDEIAFEGSMK